MFVHAVRGEVMEGGQQSFSQPRKPIYSTTSVRDPEEGGCDDLGLGDRRRYCDTRREASQAMRTQGRCESGGGGSK